MEPSSSSHNWDESPPPYRGRGYQKLGQADEEHQMYPYRSHHAPPPPPPTSYAPAPASMPPPAPQHSSFSNNNTNVVVVSQQPAAAPNTVVVERLRPNDNLIWAVCLMVFCFLTGNLVAFLCLIPALAFSLCSGCASDGGDYEAARRYAKASCVCSLCSVAIYLIAFVVAGVLVALYFTIGLAFLSSISI